MAIFKCWKAIMSINLVPTNIVLYLILFEDVTDYNTCATCEYANDHYLGYYLS